MRARPAWSLLWGVLRGWPARPAAGHILARLRICLPLAARTRPSKMWYSTHVASAGFVSSVPACPPVQAVEQWCPMASLNMGEQLLSFKDLQGHELLTFSACCGAGIWSQSLSFHSYDFDRG